MTPMDDGPTMADIPDPNPHAGRTGKWIFRHYVTPPELEFIPAGSVDYSIALMTPGIQQAGDNFFDDEGEPVTR